MYNQHTKGMTTTRHRSLVERGGRKTFVGDKGLAHTQKRGGETNVCQKKPDIHESQKKNQAHRASSKATRRFLTK
jgi:hypothetical protein